MESSTPAKQSYDRSLQSFVLSATTIAEILLIIFFALVTLMSWNISGRMWMTYLLVPLGLLGLIYNFFIWQKLEAKYPFESTYIALGFVGIEIILGTALSGGLNSPLFPAIPFVILLSCILGIRAFYISAGAGLIAYGALWVMSIIQTRTFAIFPAELLYTLLAIAFGWLIAKSIDHYVQTAHMASTITNQLDSTQLSEKLMLAAIADPVIGVNKKMEIVLFNSAAEDITGWDSASASGVELQNVIKLKDANENDMNKASNPFLKVFSESDQITTDSFHIQTKENTRQSFSIAVAPTFDVDNKINGAIAVFHDISEQKGLQRERNEFVSTASHEMRTPVAAIEGYLSMAINPNLATVDDRAKNFLDKAHQSAIHLGKLFQDLLSVTKIEDQRLKDQRQVFNMTDLVTQVGTEMDVVAKKKGLSFFTHIGGERSGTELVVAPLYEVNADPERIREVLTNLIDNAVKYTPKGNVDVTVTSDKNNVKVAIRDTGLGIPLEEQKHMFEKFYRVNNSKTREIGGTGLGLYIARSLIELYGGRIGVESTPGQGSTFYFTLPLVKS